MKSKKILTQNKRKYFPVSFFFFMFFVVGCHSYQRTENLGEEKWIEETSMKTITYNHSGTSQEECLLCGDGKGTPLSLYRGQENLGIINLNTFDFVPITINRYDDFGKQIEKPANNASIHMTNNKKNDFFLSMLSDTDRGYAHGHMTVSQNDLLNIEKAAIHLCTDCLNHVIDNCLTDVPMSIGVIDFSTGDIRLFEENILAFTFGNYYISCDRQDNDDERNINLLIFYCPKRYQD